jgi:uridine kinase
LVAPLPAYITYVHGQVDLIPAYLLLLAVMFFERNKWVLAGVFIGLGISSKFSISLILPFMLIYFINRKSNLNYLKNFLVGFLPTSALLFLPAIWSNGYVTMVFKTPEVLKSLNYFILLGNQYLYILPLGYLIFLFIFWSLPRITVPILGVFISITLVSVASLQTGSIGWYYWGFPLLLPLFYRSRFRLVVFFQIWQIIVISFYIYSNDEIKFRFIENFTWQPNVTVISLLFTSMLVTSFALLVRLLIEMNKTYDPYHLSEAPISIAISGDSGVGKDTLSNAISSLIGSENVTIILGDDYHIEERNHLIWKKITPLNPKANKLSLWNKDLTQILSREKTYSRHYDHSNGYFTAIRTIEPKDFIINNGLHALQLPVSKFMDLKIFMSMDEGLRLKLKINRDLNKRGHSSKKVIKKLITSRKKDAHEYVNNQSNLADLVIHTFEEPKNNREIKHAIYFPDLTLMERIYRSFSAVAPESVIIKVDKLGLNHLIVSPARFPQRAFELLFKKSILQSEHLIPHPNFTMADGSILSLICLIAVAEKRLNQNE